MPWFPFSVSLAGSTLASFFPGPPEVLLFLLSAPLILAWLVKQFLQCGAAIWRHRWRRCTQRVILIMFALPLVFSGMISGDYLHLVALYPFYRTKIAKTSERPVRFPWGDRAVTVLDGLQYRTLVYDETGPIAAMQPRVDEGICDMNHRLIGNFFIGDAISVTNLSICGYSRP